MRRIQEVIHAGPKTTQNYFGPKLAKRDKKWYTKDSSIDSPVEVLTITKKTESLPNTTSPIELPPIAVVQIPKPKVSQNIFKEPPGDQKLCSGNTCSQGHSWQPKLMLVKCPGCQGPVLAVKMENCPICNEPVQKFSLRTDHITQQHGILAMCQGAQSSGEIGIIEIERQHAHEIEAQFPAETKSNL